jgi:ribosome biogenesis GTPase A
VIKAASAVGARLNAKREARGLRPRAVRAVVIGFPNVGKSALINRLLGRRMAESAPKPGVTRVLRWARVAGSELDLLDAPGGARAEMAG